MPRVLFDGLLVLALVGAMPVACARADSVKVRLVSADAMIAVEGSATLQGQDLKGQLTGQGSDIELTGLVRYQSVSVSLFGRIVPGCGFKRESMTGTGDNQSSATSIEMTVLCTGQAPAVGGDTYHFRLDLALPKHPEYTPGSSDLGESASLE